MNSKSSFKSTNCSTSNDIKHSNNVSSKLRRLKIEESLLLQSLQKLDDKGNYKVKDTEYLEKTGYKNMMKKLMDSYTNIKNLFDEVKTVTYSQELLAELEIDDIRNKVLELETTIKSFKTYLSTELNTMRISEKEITKQITEINQMETSFIKKRSKIPSANYNQIVPSPVRFMMTSPYKCKEVQEFQDFMKNSPNRYGGWNEYHHNIFVKYWQKHFGNSFFTNGGTLVENLTLENFVEEALFKLQGIDKKSLMSHMDWYKKYVYLKEEQQKAIDKWKLKRKSMRHVPEMVFDQEVQTGEPNANNKAQDDDPDHEVKDLNQIACDFVYLTKETKPKLDNFSNSLKTQCHKSKILLKPTKLRRKLIGQEDIERLMKPTKQWISRNNGDEQKMQQVNFIETMQKLRTPSWRQYL